MICYEEWELQVPKEIKADALWKMEAYRLALFLYDLTWEDCERLLKDPRGREVTKQLIRSAGSIAANIEEGFGRGFGKEYAYFLRVSLGSTRETRGWYYRSRHLLPPAVTEHRINLLSQITALLVTAAHQQKRRSHQG
jgi:four helix bundle protein